MEFNEIVKKRYATKKFDGKKVDENTMDKLLELIRFSASSFGLQPYRIKVITDAETKEKLKASSWGQEQVTTCSHLLVFCAYGDVKKRISEYEQLMKKAGSTPEQISGYIGYMTGFVDKVDQNFLNTWAQKQCYLALGNALNGATSLGLDSCPMEGFDAKEYSKILQLPENLVPTVVCPIGYPADIPKPKVRFSKEQLFF